MLGHEGWMRVFTLELGTFCLETVGEEPASCFGDIFVEALYLEMNCDALYLEMKFRQLFLAMVPIAKWAGYALNGFTRVQVEVGPLQATMLASSKEQQGVDNTNGATDILPRHAIRFGRVY